MQAEEKQALKLLRRIAARDAFPASAEPNVLEGLERRGLVHRREGRLEITPLGATALRRSLAGADGFAAQHQSRIKAGIDDSQFGRATVTLNEDESPLSRFCRIKARDGRPLIGAVEFAAGERLRAEFTRGQMMPRVTANWSPSVTLRSRGDGGGGMAEMTDAIVAARQRVNRALEAVGPDFSGLLLDFCCFLKGIEEIERERSWPARSAKLVLRLALASLARHYGLVETATGGSAGGRITHWGAENYRPAIKPG